MKILKEGFDIKKQEETSFLSPSLPLSHPPSTAYRNPKKSTSLGDKIWWLQNLKSLNESLTILSSDAVHGLSKVVRHLMKNSKSYEILAVLYKEILCFTGSVCKLKLAHKWQY